MIYKPSFIGCKNGIICNKGGTSQCGRSIKDVQWLQKSVERAYFNFEIVGSTLA